MATRILRQIPGWPIVVELDAHCPMDVRLPTQSVRLELLEITHDYEPDYWIPTNTPHATLRSAAVKLFINGHPVTLRCRPYEPPREFFGLRLYVESTRLWSDPPQLFPLENMCGDVRLSFVAAGESWGPSDLRFPLSDFRWRSSTYQNTWNSLVPFNHLYYHRGEDFGAIPDRLQIIAPLDGTVTRSPLPTGDGKSNGLVITTPHGISYRIAHMNIESIATDLIAGASVTAGQPLAETGMTWDGRKSQTHDSHLHFQIDLDGEHPTALSPFPFLVEAYFRDYPDALLPIAGGYAFGTVGQPVLLDASRSLARPGRTIPSFRWNLHNGQTFSGSAGTIIYDRPGYYSEEILLTADGIIDRDYLQVRIYDPTSKSPQDIASGWLHTFPCRPKVGEPVLIWNRLINTSNVTLEPGDGSSKPITSEATHTYTRPGLYWLTLRGEGPNAEPVTASVRVVVE